MEAHSRTSTETFRVTFEDDEIGARTRHEIGLGNLVWGNDYPHHDAICPTPRPRSPA
jgi:hypothetical protein